MTLDRHGPALRQIRTLFTMGTAIGVTDSELLERFAEREGEAAELAFAALVERHGPMVLRVCRQVLRDPHEAEDAFQAAFLVLARKARLFRARDSLAPWLQQVAWRTASRLRAEGFRRRRHEQKAAERTSEVVMDRRWDELGEVLHEEFGRLPARYRVALVLCYLEGLTSEQAARQLGWPAGTVRSRLSRGRDRLRRRLVRRGLAPSVAGLAAALAPRFAWSAVSRASVHAAARAAVHFATGRMAAGAVPASILTLTEGVLLNMAMTKLKMAAIALLVPGLLAIGALVSAQAPGPGTIASGPAAPGSPAGIESAQPTGPGSPPPGPSSSESDRLKAVELKLDRVLRLLEATGPRIVSSPAPFTPAPGMRGPIGNDGGDSPTLLAPGADPKPATRKAADYQKRAGKSTRFDRATGKAADSSGEPAENDWGVGKDRGHAPAWMVPPADAKRDTADARAGQGDRTSARFQAPPMVSGRVDGSTSEAALLARRLADLEARVAALERMLGRAHGGQSDDLRNRP